MKQPANFGTPVFRLNHFIHQHERFFYYREATSNHGIITHCALEVIFPYKAFGIDAFDLIDSIARKYHFQTSAVPHGKNSFIEGFRVQITRHATCSLSDTYDRNLGRDIAYHRCLLKAIDYALKISTMASEYFYSHLHRSSHVSNMLGNSYIDLTLKIIKSDKIGKPLSQSDSSDCSNHSNNINSPDSSNNSNS